MRRAIGLHSIKKAKFMIITCPVGNYYKEGLKPLKSLSRNMMSVPSEEARETARSAETTLPATEQRP